MKKLITVVAVTLLASGTAFAGTLAYGFFNDGADDVVNGVPSTGTATFVRVQNFGAGPVNLTAILQDDVGGVLNSNTGSLAAGGFFSWRPRNGQGSAPQGGVSGDAAGVTVNGSLTVLHDGVVGTVGGNVVGIRANGARLAYLIFEQI